MTVYIVDLEAVESRYTCEWKWHLPELIKNSVPIEGAEDIPKATTPGAFLNFGGTNIYKAKQIETIGRMFCDGPGSTTILASSVVSPDRALVMA